MVNVEGDSIGAGIVQHLAKIPFADENDERLSEETPPPEYDVIKEDAKTEINMAFDDVETTAM
jgi:hypothetical protein